MNTALQLQDFLYQGMLSCDFFDVFNITQERRFLLDKDLKWNAVWQAPRTDANGNPTSKVGAGYYVEMPKLTVPKPNSRQRFLTCSVVSIEERNMNTTEGIGTMVPAEDMAELVLDFMFGWVLKLSSALIPESSSIVPAHDIEVDEVGLVAYRTEMTVRVERAPIQRCSTVAISSSGDGLWVLQNGAASPQATIFYTLDGSFPGRSNPVAQPYQQPFPAAGVVILAAAWQPNLLPSHLSQQQT